MDPILDIKNVRADLFTYSLRAPGQPARLGGEFFESVDYCLYDAAQALDNYFEHVQVHARGFPLGTFRVGRLLCASARRDALALVQARVAAHAAKAAGWTQEAC